MKKEPNYISPTFWINLLFQKGVLIVAEIFGILFLLRALTTSSLDLEATIIGIALIFTGVAFEYLIWIKNSSFLEKRIKALEERGKKIENDIEKHVKRVLDSSLKTSGNGEKINYIEELSQKSNE